MAHYCTQKREQLMNQAEIFSISHQSIKLQTFYTTRFYQNFNFSIDNNMKSDVGVCGIVLQSSVWFGTECQKFFRISSEFNKFCATVQNPSFVCVIRVTKNFEICVLQAASIVGLSPAFLAAFLEPSFFRNSRNSSVRHGSVSEIPIPNRILEFRRPLI